MVQNSGRVDHLPSEIAVVHVPDKQRLCGEGVWLNLDVCTGHFVHEARLSHVGEATNNDGPRVGVDGRQTGEMLPHLLQVLKALVLSLHDGAHAAERSPFQLLTAIETVAEFQQADVVLGHVVDEVLGRVDLPQGQLVVVSVVEDVHEVGVERVDVIQLGKLVQDGGKLVVECLLRELYLSSIKLADS